MSFSDYLGLIVLFTGGLFTGSFLTTATERLAFTEDDFFGPEIETNQWYYKIPLFSVFLALPLFTRFKVLLPEARCLACKTPLSWFERIPVYSYFTLGYRCSHCNYPIPGRYWITELSTGILFVVSAIILGFSWKLLIALFLVPLFVVATVVDFKYQIIPDEVTVAGLIGGLFFATMNSFCSLYSAFAMKLPWLMGGKELKETLQSSILLTEGSLGWAVTGFMAGAGSLTAIYYIGTFIAGTDAMGQGDVKIAGFIGLFLGAKSVLAALFLSTFLGAACGALVMILGWGTKEGSFTKFAFGPYICAGSLITFYFSGDTIINLYVAMNEHIVMYISRILF